MSAPAIELGSDVAAALRMVQRRLRWRGLRRPILQRRDYAELAPVLQGLIDEAKLTPRQLAECGLVLRALQNYYLEIGSDFDADRMGDMAVSVEQALSRERYLKPR